MYRAPYLQAVNFSEGSKEFLQLLLGDILVEVLDVAVGESLCLLAQLDLSLLSWHKPSHENLLAIQQHAVDLRDRVDGSLFGLKVDEAVALAVTASVLGDLAAEDVSKGGEGVIHGLVVDTLVQVLDEDIADAGTTERGVSLGPHDADGTALEDVEIHSIQSSLS